MHLANKFCCHFRKMMVQFSFVVYCHLRQTMKNLAPIVYGHLGQMMVMYITERQLFTNLANRQTVF